MSCLMQLNCSLLKMHLFAFWPTPSLPKLISLPTVVTQLDIMWMFLYISPVFIFDQLTWKRKLRQDVLSLFTQASTTDGTTLNWLKFEQRNYSRKQGEGAIHLCYFLPFQSVWADSYLLLQMAPRRVVLGHTAPGLPVEERWFCGKLGQIVHDKDKTGSSISRDLHEHLGCLLFVVKCRGLFLASITVVLE